MNTTDRTIRLAQIYETLDAREKEYKARKDEFNLANRGLTTAIENLKKAAEEDEQEIDAAIIDLYNESGERPQYPLGLQIRNVVVINNPLAIATWARTHAPALLVLDEKLAKEYVEANGNVVSEDGELLAGVVQKPTPTMGKKTLISWLNETRYNDNQEQETQDS
jgi:hypothetical protein